MAWLSRVVSSRDCWSQELHGVAGKLVVVTGVCVGMAWLSTVVGSSRRHEHAYVASGLRMQGVAKNARVAGNIQVEVRNSTALKLHVTIYCNSCIQGDRGDGGEKGAIGEPGPSGNQGQQGSQGISGSKGTGGRPGRFGPRGENVSKVLQPGRARE